MKKETLILTFLMWTGLIIHCWAESGATSAKHVAVNNGIGLGSAIAVAISWSKNKSIFWAILHGILGWFYVIYHYLTR